MPLPVTEYNKLTRDINPNNSAKFLSTPGLSEKQRKSLRVVLQSRKVQSQLVPYVQRTSTAATFQQGMKAAMQQAAQSGRIAALNKNNNNNQRVIVMHQPENPLGTPEYNHAFVRNAGQGLVPRPYFAKQNMQVRWTGVTGRSGIKHRVLLPGETVALMATPYSSVPASLFNATTVLNFLANAQQGHTLDVQSGMYCEWQRNPFLIALTDSLLDVALLDLFGKPALTPLPAGEYGDAVFPWAQLLGGKLGAQVAVPYDGQASVSVLPYDMAPSVLGAQCTRFAAGRNAVNNDLDAELVTPMDVDSTTLLAMAQTYGRTTTIMGSSDSAVKSIKIPLPQERCWYHPLHPQRIVGQDDTTTYSWQHGFCPSGNAHHAYRYGFICITNTSSTANCTITFASEQTYAITWPDLGALGVRADPLRAAASMQSAILKLHAHDGKINPLQPVLENGKDLDIHVGPAIKMQNGHHLEEKVGEAANVAGTAALGYQVANKTERGAKAISSVENAAKSFARGTAKFASRTISKAGNWLATEGPEALEGFGKFLVRVPKW